MISGKIEAKMKIWRNVIFLFRNFFLCLLIEKFSRSKSQIVAKNLSNRHFVLSIFVQIWKHCRYSVKSQYCQLILSQFYKICRVSSDHSDRF